MVHFPGEVVEIGCFARRPLVKVVSPDGGLEKLFSFMACWGE